MEISELPTPSDLRSRVLAEPDAVGILHALAGATGLTVALEEVSPSADGHGPPCRGMSRLGRRKVSECVTRRTGLLGEVAGNGSSVAISCPVGAYCMAVPVYAMGSHVATLRAGGFTRKIGASKARADAVREILFLAADELGRRASSLAAAPRPGSNVLRSAAAFVHKNSNKPIRVQDVAAEAGVSRQHLARIWKNQTGITLRSHLNALRLDRAKVLLKARNRKIIDTAMDCGFGSLSQFNRAFLQATGLSPGRWIAGNR